MAESLFAPYEPRSHPRDPAVVRAHFEVGEAVQDDLGSMARLIHDRDGGSLPRHLESLTRWISPADDRSHVLVARHGGTVIGYGRSHYFIPPAESEANVVPEGWNLAGLIVHTRYRRQGIGLRLTCERIAWLARRTDTVFYFANARNGASIDLHRRLGFREVTRDFSFPGASFQGGVGILFKLRLVRTDHAPPAATLPALTAPLPLQSTEATSEDT